VTNKVDKVKNFVAIAKAADGELVELANALHWMLDTLSSSPDTPSREFWKRTIFDAFLREDRRSNDRQIVERVFNLLWKLPVGEKRKIGRPKGDGGRAYRKAGAILMLEASWKANVPNMTDQDFVHRFLEFSGEKLSKDPAGRKRQFNKIRKRLREARKLKVQHLKAVGRQDT
jgi:hypothetical protein